MNNNRPLKNPLFLIVITVLLLVIVILADSLGYIGKLQSAFIEDKQNTVRFLDVGQADCTLVENNGRFFLIDAGNNVDDGFKVEKKLRFYGVDTIEGVVLSHLHSDHIGGLLTVLENFSVKNIYLSDVCDREDPLYLEIISATNRKETKVVYLKKNDKIVMGTATFTVLWTPQSANENNASLVLGAECDELTFFFGGDISSTEERKMLDNNVISRFNILKASHHGSKNSGCDEFLDAVSPQYCVCFCGKDNDYSFPNEEFVNRIKKRGIVMYTTAENGDIVFNTKDKTVSLEKTKAAHQ
ncbi:MAG: MBL fold metallo-hydrolase [Clostridia bacterium]|nr:MBL fold metallo-hydrolase [Clostridia bacterium]